MNQEEWTLVERVTICNKPKKKSKNRTLGQNWRKKEKRTKKYQKNTPPKKIVMLKKQKYLRLKKNSDFSFLGLNWRKMVLWLKDINHYSKFQEKAEQNMTTKNYRITEKNFKKKKPNLLMLARVLWYTLCCWNTTTRWKKGFLFCFVWAHACLARYTRAPLWNFVVEGARGRCCGQAFSRVLKRLYKTCPPVIDLRLWGKLVFS